MIPHDIITGGTAGIVLGRKFESITDILVVGGQALSASPEQLLLAIVVIFCETIVIEQVMILGKSQIQRYEISEQYEELRQKLRNDLNLGVTMSLIETGMLGQQQKGVLCAVPPRRLYAVTELLQSVNPDSFITIKKKACSLYDTEVLNREYFIIRRGKLIYGGRIRSLAVLVLPC